MSAASQLVLPQLKRYGIEYENECTYEFTFVVRPDLTARGFVEIADTFANFIAQQCSGLILKRESWGTRVLPYPVKRHLRGHYIFFVCSMSPEHITKLFHECKMSEDIIRYMVLKINSFEEGPSAMMQEDEGSAKQ